MKFKEVIDDLLAGKRVRRRSWPIDGRFIRRPHSGYRVTLEGGLHPREGYALDFADLEGDDWQVIQPIVMTQAVTITRAHLEQAITKYIAVPFLVEAVAKELGL